LNLCKFILFSLSKIRESPFASEMPILEDRFNQEYSKKYAERLRFDRRVLKGIGFDFRDLDILTLDDGNVGMTTVISKNPGSILVKE